ncbi:MAG: ABC-ATPase UvrA, partial [Clostridiaceae bacterium]|nr:ABC-ATPase UvrA [Clostridiaceae bacterium]
MAEKSYLKIRGASENNLKSIDIDIPKNKLVVLTGISGSGKSSLAFDTIYADGQRRYMESLSSYARQFMGQMKKPDVLSIEGISPAISISQKTAVHNPRSTVGTVTEIYDYLRLLYARIGTPHCTECGKEIKSQSVDQMVEQIMSLPEGTKIQLLAPVVKGRKGRHEKVLEQARKNGYVRAFIDGELYELSEEIVLEKNIKHNIDIIIDRLIVRPGIEARLSDSIENVFTITDGVLTVDVIDQKKFTLSQNLACPNCGIGIGDLEPANFSFNSPFGACPECFGIGYKMDFDEDLMIPDKSMSINEGAIQVIGWQSSKQEGSWSRAILDALAEEFDFSLDVPFESYPKEIYDILLYGTDRSVKVYYDGRWGDKVHDVTFKGIISSVEKYYKETYSPSIKAEYESFMRITPCQACKGQRLKKESLAVTIADKNIFEITDMSIKNFDVFIRGLELDDFQIAIGKQILKEIQARTSFLITVGLDYMALSRATSTLSGGELQRIRLATQIGSGLVGVDYILDEPSIGLHQRDNDKLLSALKNLRDLGNSVLVV